MAEGRGFVLNCGRGDVAATGAAFDMGQTKAAAGRWPKSVQSDSGRHGRAPSARRALDRDILELDLEPISYLVALEQPWPLEKLDAIEFEYRCFLQLTRDYPDEPIVPSRDCDTYWHAHILALELYLEHCQQLFGQPLLHYPFSGALGPQDYQRQQQRFQRCRRLHTELMSRVLRTQNRDLKGEDHEATNLEVPQPQRYLGAA